MRRAFNAVKAILGSTSSKGAAATPASAKVVQDAAARSQRVANNVTENERQQRAALRAAVEGLKVKPQQQPAATHELMRQFQQGGTVEAEGHTPDELWSAANAIYREAKSYADQEASVKLWQAAADRGHLMAQYSLAGCLREGHGIAQDKTAALALYEDLATNHKHAGATHALALMLRAGDGCEPDPARARALFEKLAHAGIVPAMHVLGAMVASGEGGGEGDEAAAAEWFRRGAEKGDPLCAFALAVYTCAGRGGIAQDSREGFRLHNGVARSGMPQAMFNLGCHYFAGQGVGQDVKEAAYWWELAADRGMPQAMLNLGKMHAQGLGVQQDEQRALRWYCRAVGGEVSPEEAEQALKLLMQKMELEHSGDVDQGQRRS